MTEGTDERRYYAVGAVKIPQDGRDVAHEHMGAEHFKDSYAEDAEVDEPVRYGAWLTDRGADAFSRASNLRYLEEAVLHTVLGAPAEGAGVAAASWEELMRYGIERAALQFGQFFNAGGGSGKGGVVGIGDTGYGETEYSKPRLVTKWDFVDDTNGDGVDRHGHGRWCHHAACPRAGKFISMKILGDNGSGFDVDGIAAADKFVTYCIQEEIPGVLSYSLGGPSASSGYEEAAKRARRNRVLPIAASGNDGLTNRISYPGGLPSWVAVGSVDLLGDHGISDYSNRNHPLSPQIYGAGEHVSGVGGVWNGTSMITPQVARAAIRLLTSGNDPSAEEALKYLYAGARGKAAYGGAGLLSLARSVDAMIG